MDAGEIAVRQRGFELERVPGTKLITPGGRPASSSSWKKYQPESSADAAGFHRTVLPIIAGAVDRLPPIAVKLNGVTAKTKPSSGR